MIWVPSPSAMYELPLCRTPQKPHQHHTSFFTLQRNLAGAFIHRRLKGVAFLPYACAQPRVPLLRGAVCIRLRRCVADSRFASFDNCYFGFQRSTYHEELTWPLRHSTSSLLW